MDQQRKLREFDYYLPLPGLIFNYVPDEVAPEPSTPEQRARAIVEAPETFTVSAGPAPVTRTFPVDWLKEKIMAAIIEAVAEKQEECARVAEVWGENGKLVAARIRELGAPGPAANADIPGHPGAMP